MGPGDSWCDSWARQARRAGTIALALLVMVCTVIVQSREGASVHVRCEAHGQLVHVKSVARDTGDHAPGLACVIPARGEAIADHEHCPVVGTTHCTHGSIAQTAAVPVATLVVVRTPIAREHSARTTFRLAPKTSPPG